MFLKVFIAITGGIAGNELVHWLGRMRKRSAYYDQALRYARSVSKPMLVVGRPDGYSDKGERIYAVHG